MNCEVKSDKRRELENCSLIKTILMLCIVLYHSLLFWNGNWFMAITPELLVPAFNAFTSWLNSFHIYGFTLVSGYLFHYVKYERGGYLSTKEFLKKKVLRLIIPYYSFACIWVAPVSYVFYKWDWKSLFSKYIIGTSPNQLWFLLMLFGTLTIVYFLSDLIKKSMIDAVIIAAACYGIGFVGSIFIQNFFQIWTAFEYVPFAIIGFVLRQYDTSKFYRMPSVIWLIGNIICLYLSQQLLATNIIIKLLIIGIGFLSHVFGALWAFFFLQKIGDRFSWKDNKAILFLSERSMTIYLVHQQIIYIVLYILNGKITPYLLGFLTFSIALGLSCCIASVLKKYKITRFLIGEAYLKNRKQECRN